MRGTVKKMLIVDRGDGYWMPDYAVRRWGGEHPDRKPGYYFVIHTLDTEVADFFNFWRCPHRNAIVDDFGSLVAVPS